MTKKLSDERMAELRVLAEAATGWPCSTILTSDGEFTYVENTWVANSDYDESGLTVDASVVEPAELLALLDLVEEGRRWAYENGKATGRLERHLARSQGGRWREALAEAWQEGFDAGAQWQAARDADHIRALEAEVERLRSQLDAADRQIEARTGETAGERLWKARAEQAEALLARIRDAMDASAEKQARNRERLNGGVGLLEPVDLMADLRTIMGGDANADHS